MFIDTHTHIYTSEFDADRTEVVARAVKAGAAALLLPNIDEASIRPMLDLCAAHPGLCRPMMGLHPTELPPDPWPLLQRMERLLAEPGHPYVAVGEVGVDLYWDASRRDEQMKVLAHQAEWAVRFGLPLMVHTRAAHREVVEVLRPLARQLTGVFHCFGGTADEAASAAYSRSRSRPCRPSSNRGCRWTALSSRPTRPTWLPRPTADSATSLASSRWSSPSWPRPMPCPSPPSSGN